jgi:ureidoglycolate lyase
VNQNTALKYLAISPFTNRYDQSPSQTPATITMNLFACFPRILTEDAESLVFKTRILERHPFTAQTFIPMGLAAADHSTKYLVIVAPTLGSTSALPDRGPPDLANLRAFMAHGGQAVTYAAGTWHAPMVVVGMNRVDFVVAQFCNGVPAEDCEEMELEGDGFGVVVELPSCTP